MTWDHDLLPTDMDAVPAGWVREYTGTDGSFMDNLGGVAWHDAPLPRRWHFCERQTRGWFGLSYVERCACGATRLGRDRTWMERNSRRKK